jgi:hypothetical protein
VAEAVRELARVVGGNATPKRATDASAGGTMDAPGVAHGEKPESAALAALVNGRLAAILLRAGYETPGQVQAATDAELLAVDGISEKALALIREKVGGHG